MNDRIQELADQAAEDVPGAYMNIPDEFCTKFAQLIVRECCQKLEDDGMVEIAIEMKQHFGVES